MLGESVGDFGQTLRDKNKVTYEQWLRDVQSVEIEKMSDADHVIWRQQYEEAMQRAAEWSEQAAPSRGPQPKDRRYAIVIEDDDGVGLTFWIKRSSKGEIFLLYPRDAAMNPHASYHHDGTYHQKTFDIKTNAQKRQPLDAGFKGTEHLGMFGGHGAGPRIKDLSHFDDVLVAPPGSLSGKSGFIFVDLIAPGASPAPHHREGHCIVAERVYQDAMPWIVVAIAAR